MVMMSLVIFLRLLGWCDRQPGLVLLNVLFGLVGDCSVILPVPRPLPRTTTARLGKVSLPRCGGRSETSDQEGLRRILTARFTPTATSRWSTHDRPFTHGWAQGTRRGPAAVVTAAPSDAMRAHTPAQACGTYSSDLVMISTTGAQWAGRGGHA
jgi:hypothetical protein